MQLLISVLASVVTFCVASSTSALTFTAYATVASGHPIYDLVPGDQVTVHIRMSNPSGTAIYGVGAGVQGWDNNVLAFASGEMNRGPYFCTATPCTRGLGNRLPFPTDAETDNFLAYSTDVQYVAGVGYYLPIVQAISTTGRVGNGALDPGIDGVVNGGDAQFRLVFTYVGIGTTTLNIGTNANPILGNVVVLAGGATESAVNANLDFNTIPEPGAAVLIGLGLAGLASARRRQ